MAMQNAPSDSGKVYTEAELQEHVRKATATVQGENANLKARLTDLSSSQEKTSDTLLKVNAELDAMRQAGKLSEDAEAFARYEAEMKAGFAEERRRLDRDYRIITEEKLIKEFPTLTSAELSGFTNPTEMEIYALRNHLKVDAAATAPTAAPEQAEPQAPSNQEPPPPQLDRGGAGPAPGSAPSDLRGAAKVAAGLANMADPLGVLPKA